MILRLIFVKGMCPFSQPTANAVMLDAGRFSETRV